MDMPELESDTTASLRSITLGAKAASKSSKSGSHKSGSRIDDGRPDAGKVSYNQRRKQPIKATIQHTHTHTSCFPPFSLRAANHKCRIHRRFRP